MAVQDLTPAQCHASHNRYSHAFHSVLLRWTPAKPNMLPSHQYGESHSWLDTKRMSSWKSTKLLLHRIDAAQGIDTDICACMQPPETEPGSGTLRQWNAYELLQEAVTAVDARFHEPITLLKR